MGYIRKREGNAIEITSSTSVLGSLVRFFCPLFMPLPDALGSCEIVDHGGRLVAVIPSFDACILACG